VEVVAMASEQVTRRFAALGGRATLRGGLLTDNGHPILDVQGLEIHDPVALEAEINQWPGVVTVGLFARHRASLCLLGTALGVQRLVF
jgi:ribose 5-phosphate isomerase A